MKPPARRRRRRLPPGTAPGTISVDPEAPKPLVSAFGYGPEGLLEHAVREPAELRALRERFPVLWVNVGGLGDAELLRAIGAAFELHSLALEDVVGVHQRAKVEIYPNHLFVVARMVEGSQPLRAEQLSLFLGHDFVLTFQETPGDCFDPVRKRIREGRGLLRRQGTDYLAYALIDAVVDHYFPALESFGDRLDEIEQEVLSGPTARTLQKLHDLKRDLLGLRRAAWPQREALNSLMREGTPYIGAETKTYLRDCYDHSIQVLDIVETYREIASSLMDLYLSTVSNRMNEVMKVLTVFATIFMPLSFIAGIYGMNFHTDASPFNMPELDWYLGYPLSLALMALVAGGLLHYFRRRGWI